MATGVIAKYKIDSISAHLMADIDSTLQTMREELSEMYKVAAFKVIPKEVKELFDQESPYINTCSYYYIKSSKKTSNRNVGITLTLPVDRKEREHSLLPSDLEKLSKCATNILNKEQERSTLYRKSICAIEKIKTYKRLQVEFPEAYKILIEKVDKGDVKDDSICDTVESLRAELGVTDKPSDAVIVKAFNKSQESVKLAAGGMDNLSKTAEALAKEVARKAANK